MPMFSVGDLVSHDELPEWGAGKVVEFDQYGRIRVVWPTTRANPEPNLRGHWYDPQELNSAMAANPMASNEWPTRPPTAEGEHVEWRDGQGIVVADADHQFSIGDFVMMANHPGNNAEGAVVSMVKDSIMVKWFPGSSIETINAKLIKPAVFSMRDPAAPHPYLSTSPDMVNHPPHYTSHPKGIECIDVIEDASDLRLGTAIKYIWRVLWGSKGRDVEDIEKAVWYLQRWLAEKKTPTPTQKEKTP